MTNSGPCPSCGSPLAPSDQFCPACGHPCGNESSPAVETRTTVAIDRRFACPSCSAEVNIASDERSSHCPFCDTAYVAELPATTDRPRPEFVIGFAVTIDQARAAFRNWIRQNSWFRPGDLAIVAIEDKLRGVYLPFWSFAARADTRWSAQIGEHWYETETYTEKDSNGQTVTRTRTIRHTEWWPLSGRRHQYWTGYFVPAGRGINTGEAHSLMPFKREAFVRYSNEYLAGWFCEECSLAADDAWQIARQSFAEQEGQETTRMMPGDTHSNLSLQTEWQRISDDLVLLPIHVVSYRYHDQLFRFVVNGQTGSVSGQKPISKGRITVAVVIALLMLVIIFAVAMMMQ